MKCTKCGGENLVLVVSGPHEKLVCGDCLAFQKFLSKEDAKTFKQIYPEQLSYSDYLKAEILRRVEEAEEYASSKGLLSSTDRASCLYSIIQQIGQLCL